MIGFMTQYKTANDSAIVRNCGTILGAANFFDNHQSNNTFHQ